MFLKVFGGRKWTLGSLGGSSSSVDTSGFKRVASLGVNTGKLRKKKSLTSLAVIRVRLFSIKIYWNVFKSVFKNCVFRRIAVLNPKQVCHLKYLVNALGKAHRWNQNIHSRKVKRLPKKLIGLKQTFQMQLLAPVTSKKLLF